MKKILSVLFLISILLLSSDSNNISIFWISKLAGILCMIPVAYYIVKVEEL